MKQNEIIEMATKVWGECDWHESALCHLEAFAKLVAQHEREACAKVCEERGMVKGGEVFAARIRARNDTSSKRVDITEEHKHEWVGLTDEEREEIALELPIDAVSITEAKLRSKNYDCI